ncbi:MAG TPA: hypothetical protein V6C76_15770 [Drouetiella sp.]
MRTRGLLLISTILLAGCAQQGDGGSQAPITRGPGAGILGSLRPKTDPAVVERLRMEEQARLEKQKALEAAAKQAENSANADGMGRILPKVSMDPIAPPAEDVASAQSGGNGGPIFTPAGGGQSPIPVPGGSPQVAMTYGAPPPPSMYGGGGGGAASAAGLVPPPPAVTLSTQASVGMPAGMPMDPSSMYSNPYMNPYGIPMPMQNMAAMVPPAPSVPQMGHSPESLFSSGRRSTSSGDDDDSAAEKKKANFSPIIPTGMESRSAYRQRDDLKALWNGVLNSNVMSALMKDDKFAGQLKGVEIGLPGESTKGSFAISQRQVDNVFKNAALDKRILTPVKKVQTDLVQAYYRYLYSYNKYALASQTLKARKQEGEVATSDSEKQRAAADQSQAQNDADSAKDDMVSAQQELASVAGASSAKWVVSRVSGAAMSSEALASADSAPSKSAAKNSGGGGGGMFGMFHFGGGGGEKKPAAAPAPSTDEVKVASTPASKKDKEPKKGKGKKDSSSSKEKDLAPAPETASNDSGASEAAPAAPANSNGISFELKNVSTTARKSILTVSIKNGGANNFSFSPDVISISEGNHKLAEAAVRADFDQTMVQPNSEVKGTITIFGRPWNERLVVSLSEGGKTIQMSRR